jgi:uncharacterized protein
MKIQIFVMLLLLIAGFETVKSAEQQLPYKQQVEKWQKDRLDRLKSDDGWLTLVGLFWLKPGENKVGSDTKDTVVFPASRSPKYAASLFLENKKVTLQPATGVNLQTEGKPITAKIELKPDVSGAPTIISLGSLNFHIIERGEKLGVRVKDKESPARTKFPGLEYFPVDDKWRLDAKFIPYKPAKQVPIVNVLGMVENQPSPGAVEFQVNGKMYRIDVLNEEGTTDLFLIFADQTTGKETYGAGRYLYTNAPGPDGKVVVDFNKAYTPPCGFTSYATCPLPPKQNKLPVRIEAGEKYSSKLHTS